MARPDSSHRRQYLVAEYGARRWSIRYARPADHLASAARNEYCRGQPVGSGGIADSAKQSSAPCETDPSDAKGTVHIPARPPSVAARRTASTGKPSTVNCKSPKPSGSSSGQSIAPAVSTSKKAAPGNGRRPAKRSARRLGQPASRQSSFAEAAARLARAPHHFILHRIVGDRVRHLVRIFADCSVQAVRLVQILQWARSKRSAWSEFLRIARSKRSAWSEFLRIARSKRHGIASPQVLQGPGDAALIG